MATPDLDRILSRPRQSERYSYRVPTPPRIVVPPPALNSSARPEIQMQALRNTSYEFLQSIDYSNLVQQNAPLEWTYERRRQAQAILPFLYLGPMMAAKDEKWLQQEGITMLLGVRQNHGFESRIMSSALRVAERLGLEHHTAELVDKYDLIRCFSQATQLINGHMMRTFEKTNGQQVGKVLVFCESGNDRSAGLLAAYLMETHEDVDHIKAIQLCQAQRFCVSFDDGMKHMLHCYWDILCARRQVASQAVASQAVAGQVSIGGLTTNTSVGATRPKRALERYESENGEDEDTEMGDDDDEERFAGRSFAPFSD